MKIKLIHWDKENKGTKLEEVDALGVAFEFEGWPGEVIKVEPLVKTTTYPRGGLRIRAMNRTLTILPEAQNMIVLVPAQVRELLEKNAPE